MKWIKREPPKTEYEYFDTDENIIERIAEIRGLDPEKISDFLEPSEDNLNEPTLMRNLEKASLRIYDAILGEQKIVVSADIDTDGITSNTLTIRFLKEHGKVPDNNITYIYTQRDGGHGISAQLKEHYDSKGQKKELNELSYKNREILKDCDLLIIVDSSSNDYEGLKYVSDNYKCDIIILDHHDLNIRNDEDKEVIKRIEDMVTLVNPQHPECNYPNKHLSGVGVVYKVMTRVSQIMNEKLGVMPCNMNHYHDLVAVGMISDMMNVSNLENRYLMINGLRNFNNVGLRRIIKGAKGNPDFVTSTDVGFSIGPLINASARMGQIELALELLLTDIDTRKEGAMPLRLKMSKLNDKRREKQKNLTDYFKTKVNEDDKILILIDDERKSDSGFNGLVAQNLAQEYQRPCFILSERKNLYSGSGRSYGGFNTKDFIEKSGLATGQGHQQSHGIDIPKENLDKLKKYINDNMPKIEESIIYYDLDLNIQNSEQYISDIEKFNFLTGSGFPEIKIRGFNATVMDRNVIGSKKNTVKISLDNGFEIIKFNVDDKYAEDVDTFTEIEVIGKLGMNSWYNFSTKEMTHVPQIQIDDYKVVD